MVFEKALSKARQGGIFYRVTWDNEDTLEFNVATNEIEHCDGKIISIWKPRHEDIVASDWVAES